MKRGRVFWKGTSALPIDGRPLPSAEKLPPFPVDRLIVGAMFTPSGGVELGHLNNLGARTEPPTLTRLLFSVASHQSLVIVPVHGILVYAGIVRLDIKQGDRVIRLAKHTFVSGGGRYIVDDLDHIRPID